MAGFMSPDSFPVRQPTDPKMNHGRVANPPRYMEIGGLDGSGKWAAGHDFPVEKPTRTKVAHVANKSND